MKDAKREIIGLALLLDDISDYAVGFDYSSHVKRLDIIVGKNKEEYNNLVFKDYFYTDLPYKDSQEAYGKIKRFLENEINNHTVIK